MVIALGDGATGAAGRRLDETPGSERRGEGSEAFKVLNTEDMAGMARCLEQLDLGLIKVLDCSRSIGID